MSRGQQAGQAQARLRKELRHPLRQGNGRVAQKKLFQIQRGWASKRFQQRTLRRIGEKVSKPSGVPRGTGGFGVI